MTALSVLQERYGHASPEEAEIVAALAGGDFMFEHRNRADDDGFFLQAAFSF